MFNSGMAEDGLHFLLQERRPRRDNSEFQTNRGEAAAPAVKNAGHLLSYHYKTSRD
jgi:hypothetical protein